MDNYSSKTWVAKYAAEMSDDDVHKKISKLQKKLDNLKSKKAHFEAELGGDKEVKDKLTDIENFEIEDKKFKVEANIINAQSQLEAIQNYQLHDKTVKVTEVSEKITKGDSKVSGTAHASGTANAGGNWGTKSTQKTLCGELGREMVINPYTGRWYTVGDNGAEFVNLPKGGIGFNH